MRKKEALKKEKFNHEKSGPVGAGSGMSGRIFSVIKFILGVCLLPFVYAITTSLISELSLVAKIQQGYFWAGAATLLLLHLFIWEPQVIYDKGHRLLEVVFSFFQPLVKVAPYLLPIYTIFLLIIYGVLSISIKSAWLVDACIFFLGFTTSLHLIFCARTLRVQKGDLLKANYIFGFSFIYIVNLGLLGLCLGAITQEFSAVNFFTNSLQAGSDIFYAVFKQLFLH